MPYLKSLAAAAVLSAAALPTYAGVITLDEFTGDNMQMTATITDLNPNGVNVVFAFTGASVYKGDITGVWLGVDDSAFNPNTIQASHVSVLGLPFTVSYSVTVGSGIEDLGNGVNLTGASGFIIDFDLDLGLKQNDNYSNDIIQTLSFNITTPGLLAAHVDAAGARVMSANGPEGSSKLAGGTTPTQVPEPGTLGLLGAGLIGLGLIRRRHAS